MALEAAAAMARRAVSKKKRRYQENGFDLDLSYITNRIIAMGYPSSGSEALYRNPATEVLRFFTERHPHHYRIYNLCFEKEYSILDIFEQVNTNYRFMDHYPCPFDMLRPFCKSVEKYLEEDERNVVSIHCKAGKGRTGLMICVLLVHLYNMTPQQALDLFAVKRTHNRKGVTIPSQWRYIFYYHRMKTRKVLTRKEYRITHVRMNTVPYFDLTGGCNPYFRVYIMWMNAAGKLQEQEVFNWSKFKKPQRCGQNDLCVDLDCSSADLVVSGDVKMVFYDANSITKHEKMFHFVFHTGFIDSSYLCLEKKFIDKACKDRDHSSFSEDFHVEVFFDRVKEEDADAIDDDAAAAGEANVATKSSERGRARVHTSAHGDAHARRLHPRSLLLKKSASSDKTHSPRLSL